MTIKELEQRTGLVRANIRFYEQEGLICPLRRANGYRDYSEADAEALEKIKLLRQLRLDLETIRRLQAGSLTLAQAMEEQMRCLERDQAAVESARQVCRQLRDSGLQYETLTPQPYLQELERAPEGPHMAALPADEADTVAHPWLRLFARELDRAIYLLPWTVIQLYVLRWFPTTAGERLLSNLVDWPISILMFFALEPLLLSTWGTTPGKALFGLKVRDMQGNKLSWRAACRRLAGVYAHGLCFDIPLVRLFFLWNSYKACRDGLPQEWEEDTVYTLKDEAGWRPVCFVAAELALFLAAFPLTSGAMLPPNRGELTAAEYIENFNRMAEVLDSDLRLDENGQWVEQQSSAESGTVVINLGGDTENPNLTLNEKDGVLTGITVYWETRSNEWTGVRHGETELAWLTALCSQKSVNAFNYLSVLNRAAELSEQTEGAMLLHGVRLTEEVVNRGYVETGGMLIPAEDWNMAGVPGRDYETAEELFYSYTAEITLVN